MWPHLLQTQTTMVLLFIVLQSVHSVSFDPHFGQFDMIAPGAGQARVD
jgi:hypothetical protein